jgi:hypothetical protein
MAKHTVVQRSNKSINKCRNTALLSPHYSQVSISILIGANNEWQVFNVQIVFIRWEMLFVQIWALEALENILYALKTVKFEKLCLSPHWKCCHSCLQVVAMFGDWRQCWIKLVWHNMKHSDCNISGPVPTWSILAEKLGKNCLSDWKEESEFSSVFNFDVLMR